MERRMTAKVAMQLGRHVEALIQDLRFAIRFLRRARTFTATVLVILALSIGSTAAVFTLVEVLLLRPLPVSSPQRLFSISAPARNIDLNPSYYSHEFYEALRTSSPVFRNLIAASTVVSSGVNLADGPVTDRVRAELVSGNYFEVLGVAAAAGRVLTPDDDRTPGAHPVLVLSYAYWQRHFAGASNVVGRTLAVNGTLFTVVGVARHGFFGTRPGFGPDIWAPLMMVQPLSAGGIRPRERKQNYLEMIVRLDAHVDVRQAQSAATTFYRNWLDEGTTLKPRPDPAPVLELTPANTGHSLLRGQYRQPLLLLMGGVLLLLLIASANVATLLLSRAMTRAREMALRAAIGATRVRLARQLITETVLLGLAGGGAGWIVCMYLGRLTLTFLPAAAESWQFAPDLRVFASTLLISIGSGLVVGLAPVFQLGRRNTAAALRGGTGAPHVSRRMLDSREVLTVVQVALAMLLAVGAGLFARTLQNLKSVDMGFDRDNILLVSIDPARSGYTSARTAVLFDQLLQRTRAQKEIKAAGLASYGTLSGVLPAGTRFMNNQMHAAGVVVQAGEDQTVHSNFVSSGYFEAVGISLLRGRDFSKFDGGEGVKVAILNEAAARLLFGTRDPIRGRIGQGRQGPAEIEVVGLVEDAKYLTVREAPLPTAYIPFRGSSPMTLHVKTLANPRSVLRRIERELQALDPTLPLFHVQTIEARIDDALRQERLVATLSGMLSGLGILIAAVGIYGLISFSVTQRTREIGIRIAVGAGPRRILLMILGRALLVVAIGMAVGLPLALGSLRVTGSFLYGVSPSHPATVGGVLVLLTLVGLSAGIVPALNAARTDPCNTLRQD
jgi:putative ABC transport system permease protein